MWPPFNGAISSGLVKKTYHVRDGKWPPYNFSFQSKILSPLIVISFFIFCISLKYLIGGSWILSCISGALVKEWGQGKVPQTDDGHSSLWPMETRHAAQFAWGAQNIPFPSARGADCPWLYVDLFISPQFIWITGIWKALPSLQTAPNGTGRPTSRVPPHRTRRT